MYIKDSNKTLILKIWLIQLQNFDWKKEKRFRETLGQNEVFILYWVSHNEMRRSISRKLDVGNIKNLIVTENR